MGGTHPTGMIQFFYFKSGYYLTQVTVWISNFCGVSLFVKMDFLGAPFLNDLDLFFKTLTPPLAGKSSERRIMLGNTTYYLIIR